MITRDIETEGLVAAHVFNKPHTRPENDMCPYDGGLCPFNGKCDFSTSMAAAWQIVEELHSWGWVLTMTYSKSNKAYLVTFIKHAGRELVDSKSAMAPEAAMAICEASLEVPKPVPEAPALSNTWRPRRSNHAIHDTW